jgi:hypothetical protein
MQISIKTRYTIFASLILTAVVGVSFLIYSTFFKTDTNDSIAKAIITEENPNLVEIEPKSPTLLSLDLLKTQKLNYTNSDYPALKINFPTSWKLSEKKVGDLTTISFAKADTTLIFTLQTSTNNEGFGLGCTNDESKVIQVNDHVYRTKNIQKENEDIYAININKGIIEPRIWADYVSQTEQNLLIEREQRTGWLPYSLAPYVISDMRYCVYNDIFGGIQASNAYKDELKIPKAAFTKTQIKLQTKNTTDEVYKEADEIVDSMRGYSYFLSESCNGEAECNPIRRD